MRRDKNKISWVSIGTIFCIEKRDLVLMPIAGGKCIRHCNLTTTFVNLPGLERLDAPTTIATSDDK